ncbi:MAG: glycosyltransferase family 4 protein [Bacteroidia bacterium]|nr:glycosyltransferase family 4 protein [Bacteroidia bacterium]
MRIALFTDGISPYVLGGMQKHSYYVCKYLAASGIHVDLYHFNQSTYDIHQLEFFTKEEKKNITNIVLTFPTPPPFPGHYIYASWIYSRMIFEEFIKRGPVDFIYAKGFTAWYLLNHKNKLPFACPKVGVKLHGMNMYQKSFGIKDYVIQRMMRWPSDDILKKADYIFSYGGKITDIIKNRGIPRDRIIEIPTGITSGQLNKPNEYFPPLKFLFVGRYDPIKAIEEIYDSIQAIMDLNFEFHFIGPFPENKKLHQGKIVYHGELRDMSRINAIMDQCHVLVCTSYSEGMPNAVLEGMSRGMAVFATDTGAMAKLVDGSNGWLIPEPRMEIMIQKMREIILTPPEEIQQKRMASYEKVKKEFLWEGISEKLIKAVRDIAAGRA